jgi:hypothetical protein
MSRQVVVTGLGVVTAYGLGRKIFWDGIKSGEPAIRAIDYRLGGTIERPTRSFITVDAAGIGSGVVFSIREAPPDPREGSNLLRVPRSDDGC